ncbi:MAG: RagB/SusD family nutrient uptake outer membrane protein [Bacteroidales bacterium]|nr:RagB/SusD family nutrient uptake outer membrane protein [Bacteroidales bacterium]
MKKIINISVIILIILSISCEKELELKPKMNILNEKAITSAKDLEAVLIGAYDGLQSGNVFGGNMIMFAELLSDDAQVNESKLNNFGTKEIYNRATTVQLNPLRDMWRDCYGVINRVNNVIYIINNNKISGADYEAAKTKLKAEALFIRATVHFELCRFWALPYDIDKQGQNTQPGIPYRTEPTLSGFANLAMARNSVEDVYKRVINDLTAAETLLDSAKIITSTSRISAMACAAYLARVYFQKGDYIKASEAANRVITNKNAAYKLNDADNVSFSHLKQDGDYLKAIFQTPGDVATKESIFQLVNIESDQSNAITYNYATTDGTKPLFQPDTSFKYLFDSKDKRRTKYISINKFANTIDVKKYRSTNPSDNVCILRLAEMHLIRAEANISPGGNSNLDEAYESYNLLKERAYGKNYVPQTILASNLLDSVRVQRRREMCFEGDRYHNLKRMKQALRNGVSWNDPSLIFKIPQEEMSGNSLMTQNP